MTVSSKDVLEFINTCCAVAEYPEDVIPIKSFEVAFWRFAARRSRDWHITPPHSATGKPWSPVRAAHRMGLKAEKIERDGLVFYVLPVRWVVPGNVDDHATDDKPARSVPIGTVVAREDLQFSDVVIPEGTPVEQMRPTEREKRYLDEIYEREGKALGSSARPSIIIRFGGKRRLVRSTCVKKQEAS